MVLFALPSKSTDQGLCDTVMQCSARVTGESCTIQGVPRCCAGTCGLTLVGGWTRNESRVGEYVCRGPIWPCVVSHPIAQRPKEPEMIAKLSKIYLEHVLLEIS